MSFRSQHFGLNSEFTKKGFADSFIFDRQKATGPQDFLKSFKINLSLSKVSQVECLRKFETKFENT
jgi:hypothetical protein